jgi:hypothetical protein
MIAATALASLGFLALGAAPALAIPPLGGDFTVPAGTASPTDVGVELVDPSGYQIASATVTSLNATTGRYAFSTVEPGQYYIYFYDVNHGDNVEFDYYGDGGTDTVQNATLVNVTSSNGAMVVPAVALHAGARLSGTITDANKASETNASVSVYPVVSGTQPDPEFDQYGQDGDVNLVSGEWSVAGLPPGTYVLKYYVTGQLSGGPFTLRYPYVSNGGVSYDYANASEYALSGTASTTVNFTVPALGIVSGSVTGPKGPVYSDDVILVDPTGAYAVRGETADNGAYTLAALPGTYKVSFASIPSLNLAATWYGGPNEAQATPVTVSAGGTTSNISVILGSGGAISGTVVAAQGGAPVGNVQVEVVDAQGNEVAYAYTLADGTYTIADVPAGTWYVEFFGGEAANGSFYANGFYGGSLSELGSRPVTVSAGQTTSNVNGALVPAGAAPLGMPIASGAALAGLHDNKVSLRFHLAAGTGAGYLRTLTLGLPKGFIWNRGKLGADLSLGGGVSFTQTVNADGKLVITLASGQPSVSLALKAGGITVTKAIEKAAGGSTAKKPKKGKKGKQLATAAKAKKKKPKKSKDTIVSETIGLSVADTSGMATSVPITIKHPS